VGTASGSAGRWLVIAGALVGGVVLAVALVPHYGVWTAHGVSAQHKG
jgi:hypothetical protein